MREVMIGGRIQIDAIHMDEDLILVAAIGVDAKGDKHSLGLIEGATENAATVQASTRSSRHAAWTADGAVALARLHQLYR